MVAINASPLARRLTPVINIEHDNYLIMTHEMASIRLPQIGAEIMDVWLHRQSIKNALDFIFDGF